MRGSSALKGIELGEKKELLKDKTTCSFRTRCTFFLTEISTPDLLENTSTGRAIQQANESIKVDFPEPDGPIMATNSPSSDF